MSDTPDRRNGGDEAVAEQIATLAERISQARELVASGHTIDLTQLSEQVNEFCARLAKNPPADIDSIARMIEALVGDLNTLAQEITEQHQKLVFEADNKGNGS